MKKFYMILAALLIGSVCFAQNVNLRAMQKCNKQLANTQRETGWYGNSAASLYYPMEQGEAFIMRADQFPGANVVGDTIKKIKFDAENYSSQSATYNGTSFTMKIYTGAANNTTFLTALQTGQGRIEDLSILGTCVYTENITATALGTQTTSGLNEIEITPWRITDSNYWIVFVANERSCVLADSNTLSDTITYEQYMGGTTPTMSSSPEMQYLAWNPAGTYQGQPYNEFISTTVALTTINQALDLVYAEDIPFFQIYLQGAGEYVPNSDLMALFLASAQSSTPAPSTMNLADGEDLVLYPAVANMGPDPTNGTVTVSIKIDGQVIGGTEITQPMTVNYAMILTQQGSNSYTIPADYLPTTNFNVCVVVEYSGTDNDPSNNTTCIAVTRGSNPSTYTITVRANNDAFGTVTGGGSYAAGAQATLTATPNQGYAFVKWQEDDNTDNPRTITVNGDATYTAVFAAVGAVDDETISGIVVYPNPVNDMFTVANAEGATIVVVNSLGQVVTSIENATSNQTIDASSLATGTYFVKVNEKIVKINVVK